MNPVFTGTISEGKLKLDRPDRYQLQVLSLNGKKIELVLRRRKKKRTLPQNRAYFGIVVEYLAKELGFSTEQMHEALKVECASRIDPKTGLTIIESTAEMDTVRFIKYYEDVQRWAKEFLGFDIPSPNEIDYQDGDFK